MLKHKKKLYYYTSVETMKYILQGANIYATNLLYMNDAEEYSNGLKELREIINNKQQTELISQESLNRELESDVANYSISFSTVGDLLSQWSMYAGESGVSLMMAFSADEVYRAYDEFGKRADVYNFSVEHKFPKKIFYCTKSTMSSQRYQNVVDGIWKEVNKSYSPITLSDFPGNVNYIWKEMAPYVKRFEFSAEEEYRLVFDWTQLLHRFRIDYRNDGGVLKPYLDIECKGGWPIQEITVGPGFNQDAVFRSIVHFLNYSSIQVPVLTNEQYISRCKRYLSIDGEIPSDVMQLWESRKKGIKVNNISLRQEQFQQIRADIITMRGVDDQYCRRLALAELTRDGIILRKSRIPYIF